MFRKILLVLLLLLTLASAAGGLFLWWGYLYITRDLPNFSTIEDYRPPAVSRVYAKDGSLIGEYYKERRYPVKLRDVPQLVRNAFLAAEDEGFYSHPGIDPMSILRALVKNFQAGRSTQGASTITQQVVKNLLLTPEKNLRRKIKEAILSYRLEKRLSKDGILEIYLNQIFFGNTAYGIKAAALTYFHKELAQLTLAEAAILASLPKAPSNFSPIDNMPRTKWRQRYVLGRMVKAGFITQEEADEALKEKVAVYRASQTNVYASPYFVTELRNVFPQRWSEYDIDADGLEIYTTVDPVADRTATRALREGLRAVDKRRGWRGPIATIANHEKEKFLEKFGGRIGQTVEDGVVYPAMVTAVNRAQGVVVVDLGHVASTIRLRDVTWAKRMIDNRDRVTWVKPEEMLRPGDVIEVARVSVDEAQADQKLPPGMVANLALDQTPEIEGSIVLLDPNSGRVAAMVGGYDFNRSKFNRVTQSYRQPGSTFKPVVYLAAVDAARYTPSTIVYDTPRTMRVGDKMWSPGNFDEKYLGPITLQTALEKSRNLVSVDIASRIGLTTVIRYAEKLGITSPLGRNPSLALGSSEVTLLELSRAYGVLAAKGVLFDSVFVDKIVDRNGRVVFDYEGEKLSKARQAINENSAFVLQHMMKGVIERGTAMVLKPLARPVAGKTGTTNDFMDAWFIGFTPNWVCGVWVGFDMKREIGDKETGGKVAAPVFLDFMKSYLEYQEQKEYDEMLQGAKAEAERLGIDYVPPERLGPLDFSVPDGVDPYWINKNSGHLTTADAPGAVYEYFVKGTEPRRAAAPQEHTTNSYLDSPDL